MTEKEIFSQTLPDDLVEKIIARVPFPYIFKARGLSKSWLTRFSSLSSQDDESEKSLAASFQKEASKRSRNWESFSPVYFGKEDLIAYSRASENWGRLPSLSFLPQNLFQGSRNRFLNRSNVQMEGPLLYGFDGHEYRLHVANILTQSWKQLPTRPNQHRSFVLCKTLVLDPSSDTYKLILFCQDVQEYGNCTAEIQECGSYVRIYDSKLDSWTSKKFIVSGDFTVGPPAAAYLNGILYMVAANNPQNLLAINLEEGTSEELRLAFDDVIEIVSVNLVVCKGDWLMIVTKGLYPETLQLLKIDLGLERLVQLAKGPPHDLNVGKIYAQPVGDGNCIFFRVEEGGSRALTYNLDKDEWGCFPIPTATCPQMTYKWIGSSFQPGLSPFVAV